MTGFLLGGASLAATVVLTLLAGCAAQPPAQSTAATVTASGDRQGHFNRAAGDMSMCVGMEAHAAHPELEFDLNVTPPATVAAKKYRSDETNIWAAEFQDAVAGGTDVVLHNVTASPANLDEIWQLVERCAG